MSEHEYWEELAAGYALSALEPADEAEFTDHMSSCAHCQDVLGEHAFVAAQLGALVDTGETPDWSRIRPAVMTAPAVTTLETVRARRRLPMLLGAAASVALVAGGGAVLLTQSGSSVSPQQSALQACTAVAGCHLVRLQDRAVLVVQDGSVKVLPTRLGKPPSGEVYVLWQLPRDGRPTMVATLDETSNGRVGEPHTLALSYAKTAAFGLSEERADAVPTQPTDIVAVGGP